MANLIGMLSMNGHADTVPFYLKRMEDIATEGRRATIQHFCDVELQYQTYYLNNGMTADLLQREKRLLNRLKDLGRLVPDDFKLSLYYNLGMAQLLTDDPKGAKRLFQRIRNLGDLPERPDLQGVAILLRLLLVSVEESLPHFLRNSGRYFKKMHRLHRMENMVLKWLKRHGKLGVLERKDSYMQLAEGIQVFRKSRCRGADEVAVWALSQASGRPIRELYAEELKNGGGR